MPYIAPTSHANQKAGLKLVLVAVISISAGIVWHRPAVGILALAVSLLYTIIEAEAS